MCVCVYKCARAARSFLWIGSQPSRLPIHALVAAFHYTRAIFTHCIQFGFTYSMIYSAKAYLEAGDGNLLEAEVALKAGAARCAGRGERERDRQGERNGGKSTGERRDDGKRNREKDSEPRERKIKGTSFPHILYPI